MTRETRRAADLTEDDCVLLNSTRGEMVRVVISTYTINGATTVVFNDGEPTRVASEFPFTIATQEEVDAADAEADRKAFAAAIERFADRVVQARLPVPHRDKRIHIGLDLDRESDVQAWSRWLASNPQQGTSRLVVLAEVEGVEVMVRGPEGSTGEFGPDLADAALTESVEKVFGPMYADAAAAPEWFEAYAAGLDGSNPGWWRGDLQVMSPDLRAEAMKRRSEDESMPEVLKPERDGFAPPSGHAAVLPPDALKHDGRYDDNGGTEA